MTSPNDRYVPYLFTCTCGKRAYDNRADAKRVVKVMRRLGKARKDERLNAYRCAETGRWHVGNTK